MPVRKLPSGRYQAKYLHPHAKFTASGTRNYIAAPFTFRTKGEAQEWLTKVQADIARGSWKSAEQIEAERLAAEIAARVDSMTFGEYAATYLETHDLRVTTRRMYGSYLANHLLPRWEDVPLRAITTPDIKAWLIDLAPGAPTARKQAFDLFGAILNDAVADDYLQASPVKRNMLGKVRAAPVERKQRGRVPRALSLAELTKLADTVPDYLRLPVLLAGTVGLRSGEVRATTGKSVESRPDGTTWLHITQGVTGEGARQHLGDLKTDKSKRIVPVPASLAGELVALAAKVGPDGYLFHPRRKTPAAMVPYGTWYWNIQDAAERAGIGHVTPHDLRTTAASLAAAAGAAPTTVRDLLGHTKVTMTDDYTKAYPDDLARVVGSVDRERTNPDPGNVVDLNTARKEKTA